jgi:RNA polymerase sigma factor (sigma-70 family)
MYPFIYDYCRNDAKKLRTVINKIFAKKYGGTKTHDMAEFYSVANDVLIDIWDKKRYNPEKGNFDALLYRALDLAIIDEMKRQTAKKRIVKLDITEEDEFGNYVTRRVSIQDVRLDAPVGDEEQSTLGDFLASDCSVENESGLFEEDVNEWHERTRQFLASLSPLQRKIIIMIAYDKSPEEICNELSITMQHYNNSVSRIYSDRKIDILRPQK